MRDLSEEVLSYWENMVTEVGEKLDVYYEVINVFKSNKEFESYINLAVRQYLPSLEDLIILGSLSCCDYLKRGMIGKINLIWFCYDIRDQLVKKLISLDEEKYSYICDIKEQNYNDLTNIEYLLELLSSEKSIYKVYNSNKLKYLKNA